MRLAFIFIAGALLGMSRVSTDKPSKIHQNGEIQVMPVARTPESNTVILRIAVPKPGSIVAQNPVWVQCRVDGYALGVDSSQFERASEIAVSNLGQTVHVIIDNEQYFAVNEPAISPFNEDGYYYTTSYKFKVPFALENGVHTIRVFPARSFGESLKGDNAFFVTYFSIGNSSGINLNQEFLKPYLTYNEPSDQMVLTAEKPILLDFLISNCELTSNGYNVRLSIDEKLQQTLTSWQPYYIYGLPQGEHTIHLELFNKDEKVPGIFNDIKRTIFIR